MKKFYVWMIAIVAFLTLACGPTAAVTMETVVETPFPTVVINSGPYVLVPADFWPTPAAATPTEAPTEAPPTTTPEAGLPQGCEFEEHDSQTGATLSRSEFSPLPEGETAYPILQGRADIVFTLKGQKLNISVTADGEVQKRWSAILPDRRTFVILLYGPDHDFVIFGPLFLTACQGRVYVNDRHLGDILPGHGDGPSPTPTAVAF